MFMMQSHLFSTELRLVGGNGCYGRLEICYGAQWGTVCDDSFDYSDLTVACYQLGYSPYTYWTGTGADSDVPIFLDDLSCYGSESRLEYCCHPPVGEENCSHSEDVTIYCTCKHTFHCITDIVQYLYINIRTFIIIKKKVSGTRSYELFGSGRVD